MEVSQKDIILMFMLIKFLTNETKSPGVCSLQRAVLRQFGPRLPVEELRTERDEEIRTAGRISGTIYFCSSDLR